MLTVTYFSLNNDDNNKFLHLVKIARNNNDNFPSIIILKSSPSPNNLRITSQLFYTPASYFLPVHFCIFICTQSLICFGKCTIGEPF